MSRTEEFQREYAGGHQPPSDGAPLHDLTSNHYPATAYDELQYYTNGSGRTRGDQEAMRAVRQHRGKPDALVTVHRAAPHGVTSINPGDWVSTSRSYVEQHAKHATDPAQDMPVHSARVPAKHVLNGGNDLHEWGYHGPDSVKVKTRKPPARGWPE